MDALVVAPSAATRATAAEVAEEEDAGRIVALVRAGAIGLARTTGRASLVRPPGETSLVKAHGVTCLVRIGLKVTLVFHLCHHRQEGTKIVIKTMGLGASKNLVPSRAS
jgi:hypothetical protein